MDIPSIQERRKSKRFSLAYYMLVLNNETLEKVGHLVDINTTGLMMDSQKPLPLGKDFHLRMDVSPDVSKKAYINFIARTKWCLPDVIEPYLYDIGFKIVKISPSDAEVIQHIMDKYATRDRYSSLTPET